MASEKTLFLWLVNWKGGGWPVGVGVRVDHEVSHSLFPVPFPSVSFHFFPFFLRHHMSHAMHAGMGGLRGNGVSGVYRTLRHTIDITMSSAPLPPLIDSFFGPLVLNFLFASILGINFHFISQSVQTRLHGL